MPSKIKPPVPVKQDYSAMAGILKRSAYYRDGLISAEEYRNQLIFLLLDKSQTTEATLIELSQFLDIGEE